MLLLCSYVYWATLVLGLVCFFTYILIIIIILVVGILDIVRVGRDHNIVQHVIVWAFPHAVAALSLRWGASRAILFIVYLVPLWNLIIRGLWDNKILHIVTHAWVGRNRPWTWYLYLLVLFLYVEILSLTLMEFLVLSWSHSIPTILILLLCLYTYVTIQLLALILFLFILSSY